MITFWKGFNGKPLNQFKFNYERLYKKYPKIARRHEDILYKNYHNGLSFIIFSGIIKNGHDDEHSLTITNYVSVCLTLCNQYNIITNYQQCKIHRKMTIKGKLQRICIVTVDSSVSDFTFVMMTNSYILLFFLDLSFLKKV